MTASAAVGEATDGSGVRLAICGVGSAAMRAHLPALGHPGRPAPPEVVGIADHDGTRLDAALGHLPRARAFDAVEAMLDATSPTILVVATPPSAHRRAIAAAVERGIHVLCEKPVGLDASDVASLRQLRRRHPETLMATVLQYRHAPTWRLFAEAVRQARRRDEEFSLSVLVERPGTDPLSAGGWRAQPLREGGILGDHAVHYLALCWGLDPAARVVGCARSGDGGAESATVTLSLGRGTAEIHVTYQGRSRRNLITFEHRAEGLRLHWENDGLFVGNPGPDEVASRVEALSDRGMVNDLYVSLYDELLENLDDGRWRAARSAETVGVAGLLAAALAAGSGDRADVSTPAVGQVP
ncbi:MAG: Gfo/Idh/MocA family protein [Candidatus Dormibacteria bacterium]